MARVFPLQAVRPTARRAAMLTLRTAAFAFLAATLAVLAARLWVDLPVRLLAHGILALGALPLMLAAILHFVPVLTRSGGAAAGLRLVPWLGATAGLTVLTALIVGGRLAAPLAILAAAINFLAALALATWIWRRRRNALGPSHPGLYWYLAALMALALAMVAATLLWHDAPHAAAWRRLHIHLNVFGWVTLTVLGTAPVLLPTVLGHFDPTTAPRLRRLLPWAAAGGLALAVGAARPWAPLAVAGALMLIGVVVTHLRAWARAHGNALGARGSALSLVLALAALVMTLAAGAVHATGAIDGARMLAAFVVGVLLPLVTGALAHLLPVWRYPGADSPARQQLGQRLRGFSRSRAIALAVAGVAQYLGGGAADAGFLLAFLALLHFAWLAVATGRVGRV